MAPLSEWNKAVKTAFKMGRKTKKNYSLKEAMFAAKKIYKKSAQTVMNMGNRQTRRRSSTNKGYKRGKMHRGGSGITTQLSHSNVNESNPIPSQSNTSK